MRCRASAARAASEPHDDPFGAPRHIVRDRRVRARRARHLGRDGADPGKPVGPAGTAADPLDQRLEVRGEGSARLHKPAGACRGGQRSDPSPRRRCARQGPARSRLPQRRGGLEDEPTHGGVDGAPQKGGQARDMQLAQLLGRAGGRTQQPAGDSDPVEHPAQRRKAVGIADEALGAGGLDPRATGLLARDDAHRVALLEHPDGKLPAPAATADESGPAPRRASYVKIKVRAPLERYG